MKSLNVEKMEMIEGGGEGALCFGVGALTAASLGLLTGAIIIYQFAPAIKYCWNS